MSGSGCGRDSSASSDAPPTRSLLVWNVDAATLVDEDGDGQSDGSSKSDAQRAAFLDLIKRDTPDFLLLQEPGTWAVASDLSECGIEYIHSTGEKIRLLSNDLISTNHPSTNLSYRVGGESYTFDALDLECFAEEQQAGFRLLSARLQPTRALGYEQRRNESRLFSYRIRDALKESPDSLVLAVGSFNDDANSPLIQKLCVGDVSIWPLADTHGDRWTHHDARTDTYTRRDYLLVHAPAAARWKVRQARLIRDPSARQFSSHAPIWIELQRVSDPSIP